MTKAINLYKFVSKDEYRPALNGVFHDAERETAVACDMHILVASRGAYDPEKAGRVVLKDGTTPVYDSDHKEKAGQPIPFPKWYEVIPKNYKAGFPMAQLRKAVKRAENFMKNAPQTWEDGKRIRRKLSDITLVIVADGIDAQGIDKTYNVGLRADFAKELCSFPEEGAVVTFQDDRRAIYYNNEKEGIQAVVMPVCLVQSSRWGGPSAEEKRHGERLVDMALYEGICDTESEDRKARRWTEYDTKLYLGRVLISACGKSAEAAELFREPEKKAPDHFVPCIDYIGRNLDGECLYGLKKRLSRTLSPLDGTSTFYTRKQDKDEYAVDIYKKSGEVYVITGECNVGSLPRVLEMIMKYSWDTMTFEEIAERQGWTEENHKVTRAFYEEKKKGEGVSSAKTVAA